MNVFMVIKGSYSVSESIANSHGNQASLPRSRQLCTHSLPQVRELVGETLSSTLTSAKDLPTPS
jgi:hypothetical protein